jgi:hypothetical protein
MILKNTFNDPNLMMRIGTVCLLLALFAQRFVHPTSDFSSGFLDGLNGALVGASIALNLLALRSHTRRHRDA